MHPSISPYLKPAGVPGLVRLCLRQPGIGGILLRKWEQKEMCLFSWLAGIAAGWRGLRYTSAHPAVAECAGVALMFGILREWMGTDGVLFMVRPPFSVPGDGKAIGAVLDTPELPTKGGLQSCMWWVRVPW